MATDEDLLNSRVICKSVGWTNNSADSPKWPLQSNGCATRLDPDSAGLTTKMKQEIARGEPGPDSRDIAWTNLAFLDTRVRVLQVTRDVQSVTCSN